jgi:hypothetical protein
VVVKGGARSNAGELAFHLLRTDTNEQAIVCELRGVEADTLAEALYEMEAVASGAATRRPFYHASINSDPDELPLTKAQKRRAIEVLERELGLSGHSRAVVEHGKHGRGHTHVVWSRIDLTSMKAIQDGFNYRKHEAVARQLEREFGHKPVQGAHVEREGKPRPARTPTHAEMMQAARSGIPPEETKRRLVALWNASDSGQAFAAALEAHGYVLACGDRRGFVALDPAGEAHSINKKITGLVAAQVRERLVDIELEQLPDVKQARALQQQRRQAQECATQASAEIVIDMSPKVEPLAAVTNPDQAHPKPNSPSLPPFRPYRKLLKLVNVAIHAVEAVAGAISSFIQVSRSSPTDELRGLLPRASPHELELNA